MVTVKSSKWYQQESLLCTDHRGQEEQGGHGAVGDKLEA